MMSRSKFGFVVWVLVLLAFGATGIAYYLWRQNVELRERLQAATARAVPSQQVVRRVREGDQLPEFTARDTEGRKVQVAARGAGKTLLFIYDPGCDRCEAAIPAWIKVDEKLKRLAVQVRVIALSVGDSYATVQHARKVKFPFAAVPFPGVELQRKFGATEVPLTVVVDSQGVVQAVWDKPLDSGEIGDVIGTVCPQCLKRVTAGSFF